MQSNPFAQWAGKPYNDYRKALKDSLSKWGMGDVHLLIYADSDLVHQRIAQMRAMPATRDCQWQLEADMLEANLDFPYFEGDSALYMERMGRIIECARQCDNVVFEVRLYGRLAQYTYDRRYLLDCVEYSNLVEEAINKANAAGDPNDPDPDVLLYTFGLGENLMVYNIIDRAQKCFERIVGSPIVGIDEMQYIYLHSLNNLAIIQRDNYHNLERSDSLFKLIEPCQKRLLHPVMPLLWRPIVMGNLGRNEMLRHNYASAATMIRSAVDTLRSYCDWGYVYNRTPQLAQCYMQLGQLELARKYIALADSCRFLVNWEDPPVNSWLYMAKNQYYSIVEKNDLAAQYLDSVMIENDRVRGEFNVEHFLQTEQLAAERKLNYEHSRRVIDHYRFVGTLIFALFVSLFGAIFVVLYVQKRKAYRTLVDKNMQIAANPANRELLCSVRSDAGAASDTDDSLCEVVRNSLERDEAYLNPDISLDMLAREIGTNRSYISNAVNRIAPNFNALVNDYRIKAALRIMEDDPHKSVEEIAIAVGFNNRRTFYNAFKVATGLSPAVFRKNM